MAYTISPLHSPTPLTFPRLAQTFIAAFSDHPLISLLYPHTPPQARLEYEVKEFEKQWAKREAEGLRWWVVREVGDGEGEGDGEVVAWAKWVVPHKIREGERKGGEIGGWPEGADVELCEDFFGKLREGRRKWVGEKEYFLETLAVHPSHQRKGLGTLLIKTGLDLADRDRARTYIEASAKGLPLYLKHGWEPVGATVVDMRKYGGGGEAVVTETTLIRLPKTVG